MRAGRATLSPMQNEHAALSSASTTLADLADRVEGLARSLDEQNEDTLALDLYEVERTLRMAIRRLDHVVQRMR
jgi:hypothetical protein